MVDIVKENDKPLIRQEKVVVKAKSIESFVQDFEKERENAGKALSPEIPMVNYNPPVLRRFY